MIEATPGVQNHASNYLINSYIINLHLKHAENQFRIDCDASRGVIDVFFAARVIA